MAVVALESVPPTGRTYRLWGELLGLLSAHGERTGAWASAWLLRQRRRPPLLSWLSSPVTDSLTSHAPTPEVPVPDAGAPPGGPPESPPGSLGAIMASMGLAAHFTDKRLR
jgi:hypothetical protein